MANFYGKGRTNTFQVNDVAALKAVLEPLDFTVLTRGEHGSSAVSIFADDPDGTGSWWRHEGEPDEEFYVPDMIAEHLSEGEIAIFLHIGSEKQRCLLGSAVAVHSNGRQVQIHLDDIYLAAAAMFGTSPEMISDASY